MSTANQQTSLCISCHKQKDRNDTRPLEILSTSVAELIKKEHPDWSSHDYICLSCLNKYRAEYVEDVLRDEKGELTNLEQSVLESLREHEVLSKDINLEFDSKLTAGQRLADKIADFGGSWGFITSFMLVLIIWIIINSSALFGRHYDPYPFILLNLILSCLAAIQAPVIMMSQNRQESKDRLRAEHDYQVNLKAELEIRHINAKIDQLISHQWQRLLEIQKIQMELMEDINRRNDRTDDN
ncbi:conserved hypothetical protein [Candidatus Zixiibacteriota bacterium]|nr:conserved hypothetical protein [candidate division Zixibacteria bacterium]